MKSGFLGFEVGVVGVEVVDFEVVIEVGKTGMSKEKDWKVWLSIFIVCRC